MRIFSSTMADGLETSSRGSTPAPNTATRARDMPGTLAIGRAGAINAALLGASIVGLGNARIMAGVERWRARQTKAVALEPTDEPAATHR